MNKSESIIIFSCLALIIILGSILIFKMKSEPLQDPKIYSDIYTEYNKTFNVSTNIEDKEENIEENDLKNNNELDEKEKNKIINYDKQKVIGEINIPKLNITYPIIYKTTDEYLKVAPTKLSGPDINKIGNFCIVAHNYRYNKEEFFSRLNELNIGDKFFLTDVSMKKICYKVIQKNEIDENDLSCIEQNNNGKRETTLITCTNNSKKRLIVKGVEE